MSENKTIVERLMAAKANFGVVAFDSKNPHFNSRYASLLAIKEAVDGPLAEQGLLPLWRLDTVNPGEITIEFALHTADGQEIRSGKVVFPFIDPQKAGSAITYGKRYTISALLGVVGEEDDDGNAASTPKKPAPTKSAYNPAHVPDEGKPVPAQKPAATPVSEATRSMFGEPPDPLPPPDTASHDKAERARAKETGDRKKGTRLIAERAMKKKAGQSDIEQLMISLDMPVTDVGDMTYENMLVLYRALDTWTPPPPIDVDATLAAIQVWAENGADLQAAIASVPGAAGCDLKQLAPSTLVKVLEYLKENGQ